MYIKIIAVISAVILVVGMIIEAYEVGRHDDGKIKDFFR